MKAVLLLGRLQKNLQARSRAMAAAGLNVAATRSADEASSWLAENHYDLVVIGPSVSQEERIRVAKKAKSAGTRTLFLYHQNITNAESGDALISSESPMEDLIDAVLALIA